MGANASALEDTGHAEPGQTEDLEAKSAKPSEAKSIQPLDETPQTTQSKTSASSRRVSFGTKDANHVEETQFEDMLTETANLKTKEKWEGALAFLNNECCYAAPEVEQPVNVKRSMSFAAKRALRIKNWVRRLKAACMKRGRTRRLERSERCAQPRNIVGEIVMSPAAQGLVLLVICLDVSVSVYRFMSDSETDPAEEGRQKTRVLLLIDWVVVSVLTLEVCARMFFLGSKFTWSLLNLMELAVVPVAIFLLVTSEDEDKSNAPVLLRTLRPLLRTLNLLLKAARLRGRVRQLQGQLRLQVGGNRRRWKDGVFDLDLCYIIDGPPSSLIAMGRPAVGSDAFYNNPQQEVATFMDKKHPNKYLIINAGEKVDYPIEPFHSRVILFPLQAFSVPKLIDLWDLCSMLRDFLNREGHCVAVHTNIGGGRSGLVIIAYLLYTQAKRQAADAMSYYEKKLTEPFSQETVSGVDCESQKRFMEYFSVCVRELRFVPDPPRKAKLKRIKLLGVEPEMSSWLSVKCFAHSIGTSARSVLLAPNAPKRFGSFQTRSRSFEQEEEEENKKNEEEAVLFMKDEDEIMQQAQREREFQEFDSVASGCRPLHGNPLLDTAVPGDPKVVPQGEETLQTEVLVWQIDGLEVSGEICFEIHRALDAHSGATQLLLATWLHTSFLEMSQGSQGVSTNSRSVCVTLTRFEMDKGANAPSLRSYGSSFQVQLLFEVDEVMQYHWDSQVEMMDEIAELTGKSEYRSDALRLSPPIGEDVSDSYRATWLTWGVGKLWPSIDAALQKLAHDELEPELKKMKTPLGSIGLKTFSMGTQTPELGPITASQRSGVHEHQGLQLDIFMRYQGDANIEFLFQTEGVKVGVTHVGVNGTLSLLFDPIEPNLPIVGGMHIFFLNPPQVVLTFVGLADPLNLGILKTLISNQFNKLLADKLVLPNVLTINWKEERFLGADPVAWLSSMLPIGVLRVTVTELEPITPAEWRCKQTESLWQCTSFQGPGRYIILRLGAMEKSIDVIGNQLTDDNVCFLLVFDNKQNFTIEVWEREPFGQDRLLGTSQSQQMALHDLLGGRGSLWVPLEAAMGGDLGSRVRLKTTLHELIADKTHLPPITEETPKEREENRDHERHQTQKVDVDEVARATANGAAGNLPTLVNAGTPILTKAAALASPLRDTNSGLEDKDLSDEPVALLIIKLIKGSVKPVVGSLDKDYELRASVTDDFSDQKQMTAREQSGVPQDFEEISETVEKTIQELSKAGFPSDKIAAMLKIEEVRVAKVVARSRGFNVECPHHLCVLVPGSSFKKDSSVTLEVMYCRTTKGSGEVQLSSIVRSKMRFRGLVDLNAGTEGHSFRLDVELRLFAFASQQKPRPK